ncbi:MAG: glycoside hydrolase family 26 protein, partial [Oscillospiraceae bacterium]|nr:glycoside hydrolase family 26 protein [Oscillospiraceae bacterium]
LIKTQSPRSNERTHGADCVTLRFNQRVPKLLAVLLSVVLLCGCQSIPNRPESSEADESAEPVTEEPGSFEELSPTLYDIYKSDELIKLNAEGGVFNGSVRTDGEYDGHGYVVLDEGMTLTHIAEIPLPQHYRVIIAAWSEAGAVIKLSVKTQTEGMYYVEPSDEMSYGLYAIDSVYMTDGAMLLNFTVESGSVAIDYILVEDTVSVDPEVYLVHSSSVSSNASVAAIGVMKYLTDTYGKGIITAQNVTPATNAELDAIHAETGRYPAMRCGELALSLLEDEAERAEEEIQLALEWGKKGGLVSYTWHWYSPDTSRAALTEETNFRLTSAIDGQDTEQLALKDAEEIQLLYDSGFVSDKMLALIKDLDKIAEVLKRFDDEDIPVIWQPVPDGETKLYWWGGNSEEYKRLWQFIFNRLNKLHGLGNLVWVWNGSDAEFYPGNSYCDIIGQSVFEKSGSSFAGRFSALSSLPDTQKKPLAITSCDSLPKPEYMYRDNAMWLWFAIGSGSYIVDSEGSLSEVYTDWQSLYNCYNSKICRTLDELPDFNQYALSG